jgi:hypothetical protein
MRKINIAILLSVFFVSAPAVSLAAQEQENDAFNYRRSSLYSILISHPNQNMDDEIVNAFMALETPDKYNDHDLSVKVITVNTKNRNQARAQVESFLERNQVAKRMVSKWFSRNKETGGFDPWLVLDRGMYDAMAADVSMAEQSVRGLNSLADNGYELIDNTFVVVNDIQYIDHKANANTAAGVLLFLGALADAVVGNDSDDGGSFTQLATLGAAISLMIAGFQVNITSHLYQLEWNDDIADKFYNEYYYDKPLSDSLSMARFVADGILAARKAAYEDDRSTFSLKYIGSYKAKSNKPVLRGLYNDVDVFRKVLARAIDKNIVMLQKKYDQFKVKVPLNSVEPLTAQIGMKEGVTAKSKYEVLMPVFDEASGKFKYTRRGVIAPVPGKIWDNRYMAVEEQAAGSTLQATEFRIVSGSRAAFSEGMLIREIK